VAASFSMASINVSASAVRLASPASAGIPAAISADTTQRGSLDRTSWTPEKSKVESSEHQDNANIHYQPFPESVSEEHEIYADYDGDHRHHVKHGSYLSAHFSLPVTSDATTDLGLGICPCRAITFTPLAMLLIPLSKPRLRTWPYQYSVALADRGRGLG
jgi:hypothetical protein